MVERLITLGLLLAILAVLGLLVAGYQRVAGHEPVAVKAKAASVAMTSLENEFVDALERVRGEHGLPSYSPDGRLAAAARSHSRDLVARDVFEHGAFWSRIEAEGVTRGEAGETLGWSSTVSGAVSRIVRAWLGSPAHRRILLDPRFRAVGVGVSIGAFMGYRDALVVTADFVSR